jgi:hypothetical protein
LGVLPDHCAEVPGVLCKAGAGKVVELDLWAARLVERDGKRGQQLGHTSRSGQLH